jgi:DNA anti-recombination protein RmuC
VTDQLWAKVLDGLIGLFFVAVSASLGWLFRKSKEVDVVVSGHARLFEPERGELAVIKRTLDSHGNTLGENNRAFNEHKLELEKRFAAAAQQASTEIAQSSAAMRSTVEAVRAETRDQIASLREEMRCEFSDLREHVDNTMLELVKQLGAGKS